MALTLPQGTEIKAEALSAYKDIPAPEALALVVKLHRIFQPHRKELLAIYVERAKCPDAGERPNFLPGIKAVREGDWKVAPTPSALHCRRVEIIGPADAKVVINTPNSGTDSYTTDSEDSNPSSWHNRTQSQVNLETTIRRTFMLEQNGKIYKLNDKIVTLQVRPRGWHLDEKRVLVDDGRVPGGIFDFALFLFHDARERITRGTGPFFYPPKMESHLEARLRSDIFVMAQNETGLP